MEHAVYICGWSQDSDGFRLWVRSRPELCANAATYDEAEELLIEIINEAPRVAPLPHEEVPFVEDSLLVGIECWDLL